MSDLSSNLFEFKSDSEAIEFFLNKGWTDGLPIIPPTVERVIQFLKTVPNHPSEVIGYEPVKSREITIEKIAINSVMAGCLPEYFPVVLKTVESILEPKFTLHAITSSTMGAGILTVVTGPIASKLNLHGGTSVFGPGYRANATIGRAVRLSVINTTGSNSKQIDKATLGHAGKYTWCITENPVSPWSSLHEDRGFKSTDNATTVFAGLSPIQVSHHHTQNPKNILRSFKDALFSIGPNQGEIIIILCPEHAIHINNAGWGKAQIKDYLYEISVRSNDEWNKGSHPPAGSHGGVSNDATLSNVALSPDTFTIMVAGGNAGGFSCVIPLWGSGTNSQSVTKII
jgi:hypothetical protein